MNAPVVDVIIAVHLAERPIARAVSSVLNGNEVAVRALVIAHNIDAEKIRESLGDWAQDPRVEVLELRDGVPSPSGPMNLGYDVATAPFVALLGSDDELQPGTLDRWVKIAQDPLAPADFVLANRERPGGLIMPSPPVRVGRRHNLNGARDRLAYRAAPLGLMRRSKFGHLRFPQAVPTGEDIPFSATIWSSKAKFTFAFGRPGYRAHADQKQPTTTTTKRPVAASLLWLDQILDPAAPWAKQREFRQSLIIKVLRQNIPDVARGRLPEGWDKQAKAQMRQALLKIRDAEPRAFAYLSRPDWNLIRALGSGNASAEELSELLDARAKVRSLDAVLPRDLGLALSRQGPLRMHLAAIALSRSPQASVRDESASPAPIAPTLGFASTGPRMVFHAPFPVEEGATSASGIRPWKMLQAFRNLGYDVFTITGYAKERREQFRKLKERMSAGWLPESCYSEAATIPSSFTEPHHIPLVLNLERKIFRFLHDHKVPTGVFYRDVYWAFPDYVAQVGKPVATVMSSLYRREIDTFNKYVDLVFLPATQMADHVPGLTVPAVALPPGADALPEPSAEKNAPAVVPGTPLRILYVGGVGGEHYDISELLRAVKATEGVELTVCTRPESWQKAEKQYQDLLGDKVKVVHESGTGLTALYDASDVASLVMKPQEYRSFAAPMKLYEYLGHGTPVLASADTHAADVVEHDDAGWVVPFEAADISALLTQLREHPEEVAQKAVAARNAGAANTWEDRAQFAADVLLGTKTAEEAKEMGEPHVLVVPSWYPMDAKDAHGSFFREQAEAMAQSGMKVGVLALDMTPIYQRGYERPGPLQVAEENGLGVVRGHLTQMLPKQRAANVRLTNGRIDHAWDTYVKRFGKPDVLHAHSLYPGAFIAKYLAKRHGIPFVYTEHRTLEHMLLKTSTAKRVEQNVAAAASSRIGVSRGHVDHLENRFGALEWRYLPNLLPGALEDADLQQRSGADSQGEYAFGHMSMLQDKKHVDRLIDAFAVVHADDPTVRLIIGGGGETRSKLEEQVRHLGIEDAVTFLGEVSRNEIPDFYQSIDSFVLPSRTEPMGVVQIEALASGVPVISTRTWGGETVIGDGDGLLVDIDDHDQLVAAMKTMRNWDETDADRAARRQRTIDRFGRKAFVERYRKVYNKALGR